MSDESVDTTEQRRYWECPNCGITEDRHHSATKRPFCDECESRHAVLVEMKPKGKDTSKFYDKDGNARNVQPDTDQSEGRHDAE